MMSLSGADGPTAIVASPQGPVPAVSAALLRNALKILGIVYALSVGLWTVATYKLPLEFHVPLAAAGLLTIIYGLVIYGLPTHRHETFGYANLVTALRAGFVSLLAAIVLFSDGFTHAHADRLAWSLCAAVFFSLALDGVDGYLARKFRQQSELGARFDMEVDALLIFILSLAAYLLGRAGIWVLAIGGMRYLFIAAQWFVPALRRELAESMRRKLICVVQVAALSAVMVPIIVQPLSGWICLIALLLLVYSFAVDIGTQVFEERREKRVARMAA